MVQQPTAQPVERIALTGDGAVVRGPRNLPEETAVAIVANGTTEAVLMATPADLEDFAVGFAVSEGWIRGVDEIESLEIVPSEDGVECRLWLPEVAGATLSARRRRLAGPTGCGLCGIESLAEAVKPARRVAGPPAPFEPAEIVAAGRELAQAQDLNRLTRAVHGAAFRPRGGPVAFVREDVGRHNALDKVVGAMARAGTAGEDGIVVVTSRVSVEMVQKAAATGASVLAAVSAPTTLAVRVAEAAGITIAAILRGDEFEVFTHPGRVAGLDGAGGQRLGAIRNVG